MSRVRFTGAVPSSIAENSVSGDWAATLALVGDLAGLRAIELVGPGALFFALRYDPALGVAFLDPGAAADYEGLTLNGGDPTLAFSLRYTYADGTTETDATTLRVTVTDTDDTPPQALRFVSGGSVGADQLGGVIGRLLVDDPDSDGPFSFQIIGWDDWLFEFDGMVLKLRDGFNLGLDAIPTKSLIVAVSDSRQTAAFLLDIQVTDPNVPPSLPILTRETPIDGITALGDGRAVTLRDASEFVAVTATGDNARTITPAETASVLLAGATRLEFADGWLDFATDGPAMRSTLLYRTIEGAAPDATALAQLVVAREAGAGWAALATDLLADEAPTSATVFVDATYRAALGRAPDGGELAVGVATLHAGGSRAQFAVDLAFTDEALANAPAHPNGIWVAQPLGLDAAPEWQADRGGIGAAPAVAPPTDVMFV